MKYLKAFFFFFTVDNNNIHLLLFVLSCWASFHYCILIRNTITPKMIQLKFVSWFMSTRLVFSSPFPFFSFSCVSSSSFRLDQPFHLLNYCYCLTRMMKTNSTMKMTSFHQMNFRCQHRHPFLWSQLQVVFLNVLCFFLNKDRIINSKNAIQETI